MSVQEHTYLPSDFDTGLLAAFGSDGSSVVAGQPSGNLILESGGSEMVLPPAFAQIVYQAAQAMSEGFAVTVKPQTPQLTTSQVADLLGVTRPTVVKWLESGAIPYTRVGTHRKVALLDALRYREIRRERQYRFIADTQREDEESPQELAEELRNIRRQLGAKRRQAGTHG